MDLAYDHITEESLPQDEEGESSQRKEQPQPTLNEDIQAAYSAFSASPWGATIGGFLGSVVKQGGSVYNQAQHEVSALGQDATKGLSDLRDTLVSRTRGMSLVSPTVPATTSTETSDDKSKEATRELSHDEAIKESETVLSRLRGEATKRLKDLQQAEDAADEALLRFGSNIRNFLKDAISIAPPSESESSVLFESKDAQGKRVFHTSRFDAQLHVIHTNPDSFSNDPSGDEFTTWSKDFDIDKKTDDISGDLSKYPELRTTMEKLVPATIPYPDFWKRYYFLRHGIETAEARRRDLLKAASTEEEVGWDEDSDDEAGPAKTAKIDRPPSTESSMTINPPAKPASKSTEARKSNDEKSQADSEASYDIVGARSGVPSQAPNSPKEIRKGEESDEEDWE